MMEFAEDSGKRDLRFESGTARTAIRLAAGLLSALLVGYVVSLFARPVGDVHLWVDGWGVATFELLCAMLVVACGVVAEGARRWTTLVGLAGCFWALGDFANTYVVAHGESPSSPALFNYFWASYFPLMFAGLMVLINRDVIKVTAANYLDGLLLFLASATVLIAFLFEPIKHASTETTATLATNLIYPTLDMPVLGLILIGLVFTPAGRRARWYLLAVAAVANLVGDWVAVFPQATNGILGNALNAAAWPTSLFLIAAAFWLTAGSDRTPRENNASGFWVPAGASFVATATLLVGIVAHVGRVGMAAALLGLIVAGVRFWVALQDSRGLTDKREQELEAVALRERDARDELEAIAEELRSQSQRDAFATRLAEALEMADEEEQAYDVVRRAMVEITPSSPAELLLADSSRAHLRQVAHSPVADAPGCQVESPFSCVAVRRGQPVTFASSEALNACPKLRGRASGPCSAVCVPVGFMGRALGVLHTTGPEGDPPTADQTAQITTLATQTGARIGTLRAFEKTQLQASTDALTGLINRRTLEAEIRDLLHSGTPFALAAADLDKFKGINDTYGHDAGDRVLRRFSQVATAVLRDRDLIARWGGEEFTIVLPEINRHDAVAILNRIRESLAHSHSDTHPGFTVSFGVTDTSAADSLEQLIRLADDALYRSKEDGRDRVTVAEKADDVVRTNGNGRAELNGHNGSRRAHIGPNDRTKTPALHQAADEPEPRPTGREIR